MSGILSLLDDATRICREAGADPRSPLVSAIRANLICQDKAAASEGSGCIRRGPRGSPDAGNHRGQGIIRDVPARLTRHCGPEGGRRCGYDDLRERSISKGSLPPGTNLYLLVKPRDSTTGFTPAQLKSQRLASGKAGIGDKAEDRGKHFLHLRSYDPASLVGRLECPGAATGRHTLHRRHAGVRPPGWRDDVRSRPEAYADDPQKNLATSYGLTLVVGLPFSTGQPARGRATSSPDRGAVAWPLSMV